MRLSKLFILAAILVVFVNNIHAQYNPEDLHKILTKDSRIYCWDYAKNASMLIPRYYNEDNIDSLTVILDFWEQNCGKSPRIFRTRLLLSILDGTFTEDLYPDEMIDWMIYYRSEIESFQKSGNYGYWGYFFGDSTEQKFDEFTRQLARDGMKVSPPNSIQGLLGVFYVGDINVFFRELKSSTYANTRLRALYEKRIKDLLDDRGDQYHWAGSFGNWIPTENLNTVGNHPEIILTAGGRDSDGEINLLLAARFLKSKNRYAVENEGFIDSTDNFFEFFIGLEIAREFIKLGPLNFYAMAGIGYEGMHTVQDRKDSERKKILDSFGLNGGLGTRIYLNKYRTWYVGLYSRYNAFNFYTHGGTDFSGDALTVGVNMGWFSFGDSNKQLKLLNGFD